MPELATMITDALSPHFENVEATVVDCPDLTEWGLASHGLGGPGAHLVEVGGDHHGATGYAEDLTFTMAQIAASAHMPGAYFLGGGSAPASVAGHGELIISEQTRNYEHQKFVRKNRVAKLAGDTMTLEDYHSPDLNFRAHLMASSVPDKMDKSIHQQVIEVYASVRTSNSTLCRSFTKCLQAGLAAELDAHPSYTQQHSQIGLGGVIKATGGNLEAHTMLGNGACSRSPAYITHPKICMDPGDIVLRLHAAWRVQQMFRTRTTYTRLRLWAMKPTGPW
jgi:hypothetical protein